MSNSINAYPRRLWLRRILLATGALVLLLIVLAAVKIAPFVLEKEAYAGTPSIEAQAEYRDPGLMARAWRMPVARLYRAHPYEYQSNPGNCAPASIANVLRSIGIAMDQDQVLAGSRYATWHGAPLGGLTLDQIADLLRLRAQRRVTVMRDLDLGRFRAQIARANDPSVRLIANFHRGPLFGRGHGHHAPILAYLADRDLVLVGDVNPQFRPFLVSTDRLWRAADTIDGASHRKRGLLILNVAGT